MANLQLTLIEIEQHLNNIDFVKEIDVVELVEQENNSKLKENLFGGNVTISFPELKEDLSFQFVITSIYPFKEHESESITFFNKELIKYDHVMESGSICIHTSHCIDFKEKLTIDFNSLKKWIDKYYINSEKDNNYEHIITRESYVNDTYYSYIFTDLDHELKKDDCGKLEISFLNNGSYKDKIV